MLQSGVSVPDSKAANSGCAILVINLDRSSERLAFQRAQADRLGLGFTRIVAVDGMELTDDVYRRHAFSWQRTLTRNEVACLLSHAKCWQYALENRCNVLVMEDDAVVSPEIYNFLAIASGLEGCLAINLETRGTISFLAKGIESGELPFRKVLTAVAGAAAYMITPAAAEVLLKGLPGRAGLADNYIWGDRRIVRLQADPAYCMGLDVMQSYFGLEQANRASSSIANRKRSRAEKMLSYIRHPLTGFRRIKAQLAVGIAKIVLPWVAEKRVIAPYPSILANYQALRGVYNG